MMNNVGELQREKMDLCPLPLLAFIKWIEMAPKPFLAFEIQVLSRLEDYSDGRTSEKTSQVEVGDNFPLYHLFATSLPLKKCTFGPNKTIHKLVLNSLNSFS